MVCELCNNDGGELLFRDAKLRVVAVTGAEAAYRGFCRVIWNVHTKEITDLTRDDRNRFMDAVYRVETALRSSLEPDKMNIASLGNMTPHLHWHVIPRFQDDATFPKPIWARAFTPTDMPPSATLGDSTKWKEAVRFALSAR
ncbi:MAG: HIT family protein [Rhodocyclaceae bacterium]|nr:HIT family protein [Rhodocyclaceae bacterium]